jgi:hypothetical protein
MKYLLSLAALCALCLGTHELRAQGEIEALRYSSADAGWSARSMGMAGAYSSVGADISSFYTNPAGLALYKRTNLELALSHDNTATETNYSETNHKDLTSRLSLGNAGVVAVRKPRARRLLNLCYGLAYSKTQNFYEDFTVEGKGQSSLMQQFAWQAGGVYPEDVYNTYPFTAGLAYDVYGIDPADASGSAYVAATEGENTQRKKVTRQGRQNETTLGLAVQYGENLYLGATAGITGIYFSEVSTYTEKYPNGNRVSFIGYDEDLSTFGTGFNARIGAIYRVINSVKIAASYQTKTITYLQDIYTTSASSKVDTLSYSSESPELNADYILRSPSRWTIGVSALAGKHGMVSIDWAQSDFRMATMGGTNQNTYNYSAENNLFDTLFRRTNQLRAGLEARVRSTYYARAGYGIQQSPLSDQSKSLHPPIQTWSAGIGYRDDHLFADLACSSSIAKNSYFLYDPALVTAATLRTHQVRIMLSVGARF